MRPALHTATLLAWVVLIPASAFAQAAIAGAVKDSSGAILPGVTVEAGSPALIEKVRTAVTDGTGQYRIEDLRPGSTPSPSRCRDSARSSGKASS